MMKQLLSVLVAIAMFLPGMVSAADLVIAPGHSPKGGKTLRLGLAHDWDSSWMASDRGALSGYWDVGYTYWHDGRAQHSVSIAPVLIYRFEGAGMRPYIEAGIGAALFSTTRFSRSRLGSALHFESRIGAGVELENGSRLGLRASHYSNGGAQPPNDGLNLFSVVYTHAF